MHRGKVIKIPMDIRFQVPTKSVFLNKTNQKLKKEIELCMYVLLFIKPSQGCPLLVWTKLVSHEKTKNLFDSWRDEDGNYRVKEYDFYPCVPVVTPEIFCVEENEWSLCAIKFGDNSWYAGVIVKLFKSGPSKGKGLNLVFKDERYEQHMTSATTGIRGRGGRTTPMKFV